MDSLEPLSEAEEPVRPHAALSGLPFRSLRWTVLLLICFALLPAAVFLVVHTRDRRASALERAEQQQRELARGAAAQYGRTLDAAAVLLKTISNLPDTRRLDGETCKPTLREALAAHPGFSNIGLVNAKGERVCAAVEGAERVNLADRPYFQETMARNDFWVGQYQLGRVTNNAIVNFAHPVRDDAGRPTGIVYALVDLTALVDIASRERLPPESVISLFDRHGTVLARTKDNARWVGRTVRWVGDALAALAEADEADVHTQTPDGAELRHFVRKITDARGDSGLFVSASAPTSAITRAADDALVSGLLLVGALALLTFGLAWVTSSALLVRPVRRLVEEMRLLEAGELREPSDPVTERGELAALADALERMVAGLQRRRTQRDRAMDALRSSHASLVAALEATQDGIFTLDDEGVILRASPTSASTLGVDIADLEGHPFAAAVLAPEARAVFDQALRDHDGSGTQPLLAPRTELVGRRRDGTTLPLECTTTRIEMEGPEAHTVYVRDLTREKALTAQFLEAQKLESVGRLTAGLAHDFNNALTVINGYGQLLQTAMPSSEQEAREHLHRIRHAGLQAAALVKRILSYSRREPREPVTVELNGLVRRLMDFLPPLVGEDVEVRADLAEDDCPVLIDPGQMEQLIANLAVNARDAMPAGGTLTLRTQAAQAQLGDERRPCVVFEVEDDGEGIPAEHLPRVFDAFYSTKPEGRGTGLGLSSCREIVELCGGAIEAVSEPGRGTIIRAAFPRAPADAPAAPDPAPAPESVPGGSERILLAEDDPGVRELAFSVLRSYGYDVTRATDGEEATTIFHAQEADGRPFDLVVADLVMPRLDGEDLARQLAASHPDLPILFSSAYDERGAERSDLVGANRDFLPKPYATHELLLKVRGLLDRAGARAATRSR